MESKRYNYSSESQWTQHDGGTSNQEREAVFLLTPDGQSAKLQGRGRETRRDDALMPLPVDTKLDPPASRQRRRN